MHHALRDALAVKVGQLLHQLVVLQQDGPACSGGEKREGCAVSARVSRKLGQLLGQLVARQQDGPMCVESQ